MELNVLKEKLRPLFKQYKIEKAILFGSLEMRRHATVISI
jgi:hypothetical protein